MNHQDREDWKIALLIEGSINQTERKILGYPYPRHDYRPSQTSEMKFEKGKELPELPFSFVVDPKVPEGIVAIRDSKATYYFALVTCPNCFHEFAHQVAGTQQALDASAKSAELDGTGDQPR